MAPAVEAELKRVLRAALALRDAMVDADAALVQLGTLEAQKAREAALAIGTAGGAAGMTAGLGYPASDALVLEWAILVATLPRGINVTSITLLDGRHGG